MAFASTFPLNKMRMKKISRLMKRSVGSLRQKAKGVTYQARPSSLKIRPDLITA